jgi:hypothetical protein
MRIAIIGGMDRQARELEDIATAAGHRLETHTGVISGSASAAALRALVARAELIFVLTDVNSHNGVKLARDTARLHHRPLRITRRLGAKHLAAFLNALPANDAVAA